MMRDVESVKMVPSQSKYEDIPVQTPPKLFGLSSERIMDEICTSLMDPEVGMIGILGNGGVGKTAIMANINYQLAQTNIFDKIIWVTFPKEFSLEEVENDISIQINISLTACENRSCGAAKLQEHLEKIKKCLIIIDNMWKPVSLEKVGIPLPKSNGGSKVVMVSRSLRVLESMRVNKLIRIDPLREEEAWDLFVSRAGEGVLSDEEIKPLARQLVSLCNYIPILVISLGHAMRNEFNIKEWFRLWKELSASLLKFRNEEQENLALLEIIYSRITTDQELTRHLIEDGFMNENGDLVDATMLETFRMERLERCKRLEREAAEKLFRNLKIKERQIVEELEREEQEQNRPKEEVLKWLQQVERITIQIRSLHENHSNNDIHGDIRETVDQLLKSSQFLDGLVILNRGFPDKPLLTAPKLFGCTSERIMGEIWKSLMDPGVDTIGIYGIGGVGKTAMMTNLNNQLATTDIFDKIIWVTLPKNFSLEKVQKEIAMQINVSLPSYENHSDRTARLLENLMKTEKLLIIFDDLSELISPYMSLICQLPKNCGSKFVVTTRSRNVLERLSTNKIIKIDVLLKDEAWDLFVSRVGEGVLTVKKIKPLARKLVHLCNYVPILVISLGHAMRNEFDIKEWRKASTTLSKAISGQSDHLKVLRVSYSRLTTDSVRDCFLYCSFFPADCILKPEELIRYWMAEGFINEEGDMVMQIDKGFKILTEIHDANMLEKITRRGHERLKMHDLFRDLANHLVKLDKDLIVKHGRYRGFIPDGSKWPTCKKISLIENEITFFNEVVGYNNVTTFLLRGNPLLHIDGCDNMSTWFSGGIHDLQVLDMSYAAFKILSLDLGYALVNLRVLFLQHCKNLEWITSVGHLRSLQVLNLKGTAITHLPDGMEQLVKLRSLDLSKTTRLQHIESGVLSSLQNLEELQLEGSKLCKMDSPLVTNCLIEIRSLKRLAILTLSAVGFGDHLETIMCLKEYNLQRYSVKIYGSTEDVWEE